MRLKPEFDTVLVWRKESEGDKDSWHEIDLGDVKNAESKGDDTDGTHVLDTTTS